MNRSTTLCAKCFVPSCTNTTSNSRNKVFVLVREDVKKRWCQETNIKYKPGQRLFCCEDHLDLEQDLENYQFWKFTNSRPKLKSTAKLRKKKDMPSCSKNETTANDNNSNLKLLLLKPLENVSTPQTKERTNPSKMQQETKIKDMCTIRPTVTSASTHPVKIDAATQCTVNAKDKSTSTQDLLLAKKMLSTSSTSSSCLVTSSPSLYGCTSDTESTVTLSKGQPDLSARKQMLQFIYNDPKAYLGLPKQYLWVIKYIVSQSETNTTDLDLIITLIKIKLNDPVNRLCDQFQISRVSFSKSIHNGIQELANFFQNLIFMPSATQIKQNLPLAFKIRYSNVALLLDAFEIEIQKPHNPMRQAQTWSQYKSANTIKYLIGSTPNGFICFISKGYGGRISDKALVEKSGLIDYLNVNTVIMADRGFKEIESHLMTKNIKLLRPPSVFASTKPSKEDVIKTKIIASLRVHIERVIRRVREYRFLKPHSVVCHKHLGYLDHVVLIACGLINLQGEIIKSE